MGRLASDKPPLGFHTLIGSATGRAYDVTNIERLDRHLVDLSERIGKSAPYPGLVEQYRSDQSELLDRRQWLVLTAEESP